MINRILIILLLAGLAACTDSLERKAQKGTHLNVPVLDPGSFKKYIDDFNSADEELYAQYYPNDTAWDFLKNNIPFFECPDKELERIYYFRWWTYRKHIKLTPDGFIITEFLPDVSWSGKHNSISCPGAHHFYEGRWLHDPRYLDDYAVFWFRKGGSPRRYSFWAADAIFNWSMVKGNMDMAGELLPDLVNNYFEWEKKRLEPDGLFWQIDDRDGMEVSVGGSGKRATINSYMYGDAKAISEIALLNGQPDIVETFSAKGCHLKQLVLDKLWDEEAGFFKTLSRDTNELTDVRELHGYTPWYFNLPEKDAGYETAWEHIMDKNGFYAPYGLTTAEQRHPGFKISYSGHACQWNGPSWPFATSVTLAAMANLLNNYEQDIVSKGDYFEQLRIYAGSHKLKKDNGELVPWIDENLDPYTGEWLSRKMLMPASKERGKDYNHSTFNDLIITGLVGLRPRMDEIIEINPLVPGDTWDWFCLDNIKYHDHIITIVWDRKGSRYHLGKGLMILSNGKLIAKTRHLDKLKGTLN